MTARQTIRYVLVNLGLVQWIFLGGTVFLVALGLLLQHEAFPRSAPSPFAQVSVTVYVKNSPARVWLKSTIYPNEARNDSLDVTVKGPKGASDPWLLVVTCPRSEPGEVNLDLDGVSAPESVSVFAHVYDDSYRSFPLQCFAARRGHSESGQLPVVARGEDINLSLPVLEQNPLAQSAAADTPLYVVRSKSGKQDIEGLVEVAQAPESSCPKPRPVASSNPSQPALPTVSSAPGTSVGRSAPSASPSAQAASTPAGGSASCLTRINASTIATQYRFPASVATSETLNNVNLTGDRVDSMFPPGQITSTNEIVWQGVSGLSPSLSATNLSSAENISKAGFFAGLCYGLAGGIAVPFVQGVSQTYNEARETKADSRAAQDDVNAGATEPQSTA